MAHTHILSHICILHAYVPPVVRAQEVWRQGVARRTCGARGGVRRKCGTQGVARRRCDARGLVRRKCGTQGVARR
eukprot:357579-Chlamydomonas_euryale.AAC.8